MGLKNLTPNIKTILQHPPRSPMSVDDEDHGRTAKCLEDDFSGADGTPRNHMKMGMTGVMSVEGCRTGGLPDTVWRKDCRCDAKLKGTAEGSTHCSQSVGVMQN